MHDEYTQGKASDRDQQLAQQSGLPSLPLPQGMGLQPALAQRDASYGGSDAAKAELSQPQREVAMLRSQLQVVHSIEHGA